MLKKATLSRKISSISYPLIDQHEQLKSLEFVHIVIIDNFLVKRPISLFYLIINFLTMEIEQNTGFSLYRVLFTYLHVHGGSSMRLCEHHVK
jgi:hypothetical protein